MTAPQTLRPVARPTLIPDAWSLVQGGLQGPAAPKALGPAAGPAAPAPATGLARYAPGALLGSGGASEVFAGLDPVTGARLALKIMRPDLKRRASIRRAFHLEATLPGRLRHPGVPRVVDMGEEADGRMWLAMERIEGVQLDGLLTRPCYDTDQLRHRVSLLEQVARVVGSAHRVGVVHGDLKPANVLVDRHDRVSVIDWGLARVDGRLAAGFAPGTVSGTVGWMAPEQARADEAAVGPGADVWALGCMLWCLLHGEPPHLSRDPIEGIRRTVRARRVGPAPRDLDTSTRALWRIAARCLDPDPAQRWMDGAVLGDVLARWVGRTARGGCRPVGTLRAPRPRIWEGTTIEMASALAG